MLRSKSQVFLFILLLSQLTWATDSVPATKTSDTVTTTPAAEAPLKKEAEAVPVTPTETQESAKEEKRQWKLGPTVAVSFPRVTEYALEYKTGSGLFSTALISGGFSFKPESTTSASFSNFELRGRWHPFYGSFFLGLGMGSQSIKVQATDTINSTNVVLDLDITSTYMVPHIGWLSVYSFGLTFGFDVGMIVPSGVKSKLSSNAPTIVKSTSDYQKMEDDILASGDKLGKVSIPYMTLLKVGWLF